MEKRLLLRKADERTFILATLILGRAEEQRTGINDRRALG